jgi:Helix-turn-helix domain
MDDSNNNSPQLTPISVSIHDAVRLTSLSRSRIYELIGEGILASKSIGRRRVIPYAALEKLIGEAA